MATLDSFHASQDRQLIHFLAAREPLAVARIVAGFEKQGKAHHLEVRIIQETNGYNGSAHVRKEVLLDELKLKINDAVGQFKAVLFLPQMLRILDGAPEERRRYLNLVIGQVQSHYAEVLSEYGKVLTQRNALLKQLAERQGEIDQLDYWDDLLASSGAQIIQARIRAVQDLERLATRFHRELTGSGEILRLSYQPAYEPLPQAPGQYLLPVDTPVDRSNLTLETIRQGFKEKLTQVRLDEIARGSTNLGPHRDELRFLSNRIDLGDFGSRGQVRTAVLALKLAEVTWIKEKTGHHPVLLLDEVLAELDNHRRADLLSRLAHVDQSLLTTTDLDLFAPEYVRQATLWQVLGGRLVENV
jgi:DNA replication and repair protein RecF